MHITLNLDKYIPFRCLIMKLVLTNKWPSTFLWYECVATIGNDKIPALIPGGAVTLEYVTPVLIVQGFSQYEAR